MFKEQKIPYRPTRVKSLSFFSGFILLTAISLNFVTNVVLASVVDFVFFWSVTVFLFVCTGQSFLMVLHSFRPPRFIVMKEDRLIKPRRIGFGYEEVKFRDMLAWKYEEIKNRKFPWNKIDKFLVIKHKKGRLIIAASYVGGFYPLMVIKDHIISKNPTMKANFKTLLF